MYQDLALSADAVFCALCMPVSSSGVKRPGRNFVSRATTLVPGRNFVSRATTPVTLLVAVAASVAMFTISLGGCLCVPSARSGSAVET